MKKAKIAKDILDKKFLNIGTLIADRFGVSTSGTNIL